MIILGVLILVVAGAIAVSAIVANRGGAHAVDDFTIFGYVLEGSTGRVFLYGAVTGAAILVGLYLSVVGARRTLRRRLEMRRELRRVQREKQALVERLDQTRPADEATAGERPPAAPTEQSTAPPGGPSGAAPAEQPAAPPAGAPDAEQGRGGRHVAPPGAPDAGSSPPAVPR